METKTETSLVPTASFIDIEVSARKNPVQTVLQTCVQPLAESESLYEFREKLIDLKRNLFGCEYESIAKIDRLLEGVVANRIWALENLPKKYPKICKNYSYFDFRSALKLRNEKGYPLLAVFPIESNSFSLGFRWIEKDSYEYVGFPLYSSTLPNPFIDCFYDVLMETLKVRPSSWRFGRNTITSKFSGIITPESREAIIKAKQYFEDKIYIIAEAEWDEATSINKNPIVVGYFEQHTWVITSFDHTSLEESVLGAFSQKANN